MILRPGKYIEYDFPLHEVNRLAVKEANAKKPIYTMHKWWARRLSCVFRTILLASALDWEDWDRLEPWQRDADGDFLDADGAKITDEREYHRRVRRPGKNTAWERLYYRLDDEANAVIRWAFTKPKGQPKNRERLADHLAALGASPDDDRWWERINWDEREPITVLDPFMGGGTTIVEALRLGAHVVGVDLNPVAWFIVKKETDGCDLDALQRAFEQVEAAVAEEIKQYYKTTCPCCGEQADVMYVFWVKLAPCFEQTCPACRSGRPVPLYNSFVIAARKGGTRKPADVPRNKDGKAGMLLVEGPEHGLRVIKCPNPDCGEVYASKERVSTHKSTCPVCGTTFDPDAGYAGGGKYTCPECGVTQEILEAAKANVPPGMDRNVPLPHRMYAIELYCPHCRYKGYKKAEAVDVALFERAKAEFEANRDTLGYPTQEIPHHGVNTNYAGNDLWAHGYHYWHEMFNERQLLCLCRLRDTILQVEDQNLREYLLLAWSDFLSFNNVYCRYNPGAQKQQEVFAAHAFNPTITYTEPNIWGAQYGTGSYHKYAAKMMGGPSWAAAPDEALCRSDGDHKKTRIGDGIYWAGRKVQLCARSSEDLSNVGAAAPAVVVTDPPYYGNVMYAELSDFFYVWLRTALADAYPAEFGRPLTPKDEEIIENAHWAPKTGGRTEATLYLTKDQEFFTNGLTRIFAEAGRHLEDDGLLVFTFHHQANEAWASVLRTALDAGYYMTAVVPVHAEMRTSLHIRDKANISYDAVIVCRKQTAEPGRVDWLDLSDAIYVKAEGLVRELETRMTPVAAEDIYVIVIGKCMEEYSRHYWQGRSYVYYEGQLVGIEDALDGNADRGIRGIGEIVDQLVEEAEGRMWPSGLDPISRFYVINFLGQSEVSYDRLHRRLRHNPHVTVQDLERHQLVKSSKGKVKVLSAAEREDYLMALYEAEEGQQGRLDLDLPENGSLTYIDKVHLLMVLDQQGVLTGGLRELWSQDRTFVELLSRIGEYLDPEAPGYKGYKDLAAQVGPTGQARLDVQE